MKEKEKENEIDADTAAKIARNYFEKGTVEKEKDTKTAGAASRIMADWRNITILSVKAGRKDFTVKCELYDDPSSATRTKHTVKISKQGEIKKVSKDVQ
jgi:hypothetical protein